MATKEEVNAMLGGKGAEQMSADDIKAMMEEFKKLKAENDEFKRRQRPVTFSITEKGAVAVNGIGKYPFSLFRSQWERVLEHSEQLKRFMKDNEMQLN